MSDIYICIYEGITSLPFPNAISHLSVSMSSSPLVEVVALDVDPCSNVDASAIKLSEVDGAKDCKKS